MKKILLIFICLAISICFAGCKNESIDKEYGILNEDIIIGEGTEYELEGILTLPEGVKGKVPAVVLVPGSGPSDKNLSRYNNSAFKDIADYLAKKGIASIRYDKKTYTYAEKIVDVIEEFTIKEEMMDDAVYASNLLKNDLRINNDKVFILGLSLGGMIAPRIDAEGGEFAGIIIMSGSPRKFSEILYDQNMAVVNSLEGENREKALQQLNDYMKPFDELETMSDEDAKKIILAGASGYYYKDLDSHPPEIYLKDSSKPIMILQGEKDFQVYADKDYVAYQEMLEGKVNVTFKLYPGLNHYLIKSTTGTVSEYQESNNVDETVLQDITNWIYSN